MSTMSVRWYALVGTEVVGPFETLDPWYIEHAGPDWRAAEIRRTLRDPWLVEWTDLGDGRSVSTVFLGLDHWWAFGDTTQPAPPIVFETMILPGGDMWRYSTFEAASAGHWAVVAKAVIRAAPT